MDVGGRPPYWTDPKAFSDRVDKYFNEEENATLVRVSPLYGIRFT